MSDAASLRASRLLRPGHMVAQVEGSVKSSRGHPFAVVALNQLLLLLLQTKQLTKLDEMVMAIRNLSFAGSLPYGVGDAASERFLQDLCGESTLALSRVLISFSRGRQAYGHCVQFRRQQDVLAGKATPQADEIDEWSLFPLINAAHCVWC